MSTYNCPSPQPGYIPEPYHIPGYGGHVPTMRYRCGKSFGYASRDIIEDPCVAQSLDPILQKPFNRFNCNRDNCNSDYQPLQRPQTTRGLDYSKPPVEMERPKTCCPQTSQFNLDNAPPTNFQFCLPARSSSSCDRRERPKTSWPSCDPVPTPAPVTPKSQRCSSQSFIPSNKCCPSQEKLVETCSESQERPLTRKAGDSRCPSSCHPPLPPEQEAKQEPELIPVGCSDLGCCPPVICAPKKEPPPKKRVPCPDLPCCQPQECDPRTWVTPFERGDVGVSNKSPYACPSRDKTDLNIYRCGEPMSSGYSGHVPGLTFHSNGRTYGKTTWGTKEYMDKCLMYNTLK